VAVAGDVGATLRVRVTATNPNGTSAPVASQQSDVVTVAAPANQSQPTISGVAAQGQTLTALPGTWSGGPTSYAYQWLRCTTPSFASCDDIQGANAATYVAVEGDVNSQLQVRVVATNAGGDSDPATSAPSATVGAAAPENQVAPSFTGQLRVGERLIADPGTWSGNPSSYTYQWFSCDATDDCPDIAGATQQTYVIGAAQLRRFIGVEVTATNASGASSQPEATEAFGPVMKAVPRIVSYPTVGGTPQQGQTLTATTGVWSNDPTSFSLQWYSCDEAVTECGAISGATASTHVLTPADVGRLIGVGIIATNDGGQSDEEFSDLTAPVRGTPAAPPPPPPPSPQKTAPDSSFAIVTTKARTDGAIELSVRPHDAGTLTAHATASAAVLARGCTSPCSRSGRARFGRASTNAKVGGKIVKLKITPTARARRALAKARSIRVRVTIRFRSHLGGQPQTTVRSLTMKGTRRRSSRVLRRHESTAARGAFALFAPR
jgi:hypothetical protein